MTTHAQPGTGGKAGAREWIGLAVLALPTLLVSIDVSVLMLALPHLTPALGADSAQMLWVMDIYGFMLAGFMITMGNLGDRLGRRRLLMFGALGFTLASVMAAFSTSPEMLIVSRALLGIAGATISPSILALISNLFRNDAERGFAISVWMVCFMGGMTVGPLVGGFMLEHFWWGSVFLLGVPVMLVLFVAAPLLLPDFRDESAEPIELLSVALSLVAILPAIYGLKEIAKHGPEPLALAAIAAGIGFGIAFAIRQRRLSHPLLDLKLFENRAFRTAVGGMFLITMTGSLMLFANQYLQLVLGLTPLQAGLWTLPAVLASVGGFLLAPIAARHVRPARLITAGLVLAAAGAGMLALAEPVGGLAALVVGFAAANLGCAPMVTLSSGIVMSSVRPERAGAAAALSETCSEFGFSLGIAALGSLGTVLYRTSVAPAVPASLPEEASQAARDTLAGALDAAQSLSPELGLGLSTAAREAYTGSMHAVALVCGVLLLAVALLVARNLRHLPPLGQDGAPASDAIREGKVQVAG